MNITTPAYTVEHVGRLGYFPEDASENENKNLERFDTTDNVLAATRREAV